MFVRTLGKGDFFGEKALKGYVSVIRYHFTKDLVNVVPEPGTLYKDTVRPVCFVKNIILSQSQQLWSLDNHKGTRTDPRQWVVMAPNPTPLSLGSTGSVLKNKPVC